MKHATAKAKAVRKAAELEQTITLKPKKKVALKATVLPFTKTKIKDTQKPAPKEKILKEKPVENVVSKLKSRAKKAAPTVVISEKKSKKAKTIVPVPVTKTVKIPASKKLESAPAAVTTKQKAENKKVESPVTRVEKKIKKQSVDPSSAARKIKLQTKQTETIATLAKIPTEIQKIKSAVNIGRINAALKAIEQAQLKASKNEKKAKNNSVAVNRKREFIEAAVEANSMPAKTKPKNIKPIGTAIFRGKKNRYDFQVYPLDFEFENIPGIYVISKRKTDSKKRGHHALVCIGQTESVVDELKKHTKSKCVKKHEANVISILPEPNEKKRLKIEEDLRAAHSIACNLALEQPNSAF